MKNIPLIGGDPLNDGRKVARHDGGYLRMPVVPPVDLRPSFDPREELMMELKIDQYRLELLRANQRDFSIYVHESLTIDEALTRLIAHYNPQNKPTI